MTSKISIPARPSNKDFLTNILLICGIASSLHYVAINIFVPMQWQEYSSITQTVSELSAIDAPTRSLWIWLCTFYSILVIAFAWGIWLTARQNIRLRVVAALMGIYGASGFFWPPMHQREILAAGGGTLTDTLHIAFTFLTILLMMLSILFGAAAFGKGFRIYSSATLLLLTAFGILTGLDAPKIAANLPTPWIGVWERINIGVFMLWVIVFSVLQLKRKMYGVHQKTTISKTKSRYLFI